MGFATNSYFTTRHSLRQLLNLFYKDFFWEAYMSEELKLNFVDPMPMRYGENSHQAAVFYRDLKWEGACIDIAKEIYG